MALINLFRNRDASTGGYTGGHQEEAAKLLTDEAGKSPWFRRVVLIAAARLTKSAKVRDYLLMEAEVGEEIGLNDIV